jgi:hypothetical protein
MSQTLARGVVVDSVKGQSARQGRPSEFVATALLPENAITRQASSGSHPPASNRIDSLQSSMRQLVISVLAVLCAHAVHAQAFDRSMLQGLWAESSNAAFACVPSNLHTLLSLSEDGKTLTFKLDRKWKLSWGKEVEQYSATVVRSEERMLVIRYNPDAGTPPPDHQEWEMRFLGPGTYRWRSTAWPGGRYNTVIGVKCGA